jgi:hypothetical protein
LSAEDYRQVSLLTSRVVAHVTDGVAALVDEDVANAREQLEKIKTLIKVVRDLLPTTHVTTVVSDADGKEVYRHVDCVQNDRIPLYEGMVAVEVVEPIAEAKQDAAAIKGLRLADVDLLHTSVLVQLGYIERKVNRALDLLKDKDKCEDALRQLALAQTQGVSFFVDRRDDPLVKAQMALQLAERMVEQERLEAGKANLQLAKNQLVIYRGLIAEGGRQEVRDLEKDITKLQADMLHKDAAEKIRGFWDRVSRWFTRQPGEMRQTGAKTQGKPEKPRK